MLLKNILTINKSPINPQRKKNDTFLHYSLPAFDNNKTPETQCGKEILSSKFIITQPCILFNKLNVRFKRVWNIKTANKPNMICSSEFLPLVVVNNNYLHDYCYYFLISDIVTAKLIPDTNGTSSSHQRIDPTTLLNINIPEYSLLEQQHIVNSISYEVKYAC